MSVLASCGASFALYLLFAGSLAASELGTGAALAILAGLWTLVRRRACDGRFAFSLAHARVWLRQFARMPAATLRTGRALVRCLPDDRTAGHSGERPFRYGETRDPAERARRATAILAASVAPASYVVRTAADRHDALLHSIDRASPATDAEWLT